MCLAVLVIIGWFTIFVENLMKSSGAYSSAFASAKSSPAVIAALGVPVKDRFFVTGTISENDTSGSAQLVIPINGPKGTASLYVSASKALGKWHFDDLFVRIDKTQEQIDLLATNQLPVAMPTTDMPAAKKP